MRRALTAVGAALALLLAAAPTTTAAAAGSSPKWVPTATRAYPLRAATQLGAAPASTPLRVVVGLRLRNRAALVSAIGSGRTMSTSHLVSAYAPTAAQGARSSRTWRGTGSGTSPPRATAC